MRYIGIDIGGMSIKAGIVDENGKISFKKTLITEPAKPSEEIVADINALIKAVLDENDLTPADVAGIGLGAPGSVYDEKGLIRYTCNINFRNTPITDAIKKAFGVENVRISNDANCAALGETKFGAGKGAFNSVMITLGTGVGTGIVVDGKLLTGNRSAGAEGGHITVNFGGGAPMCGCGKRGHFEAYASAAALIKQTAAAVQKHPDSLLAQIAKKDGIDGKTVFIAARAGDKVADAVIKRYLKYVGIGLVNYANIFAPEVIIIGGGISNEGDSIIKPLQRYVSRNFYGAAYNPKIKVVAASLKNDAGIVGAAALAM